MSERTFDRTDDQFTNEGMGDRGGAARHRQEPNTDQDERWPDEGFGDRGGAGRRKLIDGVPDPNTEPAQEGGFWNSSASDDPAGYGGGRERAEHMNDAAFGETGWTGHRGSTGRPEGQDHEAATSAEMPEGARVVPDSPNWDEHYSRENADKYGQAGGRPVVQRGGSQSGGGLDHKEESHGGAQDLSPRGTYGTRETEKWGHDNPGPGGDAEKK